MHRKAGVLVFIMLAIIAVLPVRALLVFSDDFSGDLSEWSATGGTWTIESEECVQLDGQTMYARVLAGENWGDISLEVKTKRVGGNWGWIGLLFRVLDNNNFYMFGIREGGQPAYYLGKFVDGGWRSIQGWTPVSVDLDVWNTIRVSLAGSSITLFINEIVIGSFTDDYRLTGRIGLATDYVRAYFDDVIVYNPEPPPQVVPEPSTLVGAGLLLAALVSYILVRSRRPFGAYEP